MLACFPSRILTSFFSVKLRDPFSPNRECAFRAILACSLAIQLALSTFVSDRNHKQLLQVEWAIWNSSAPHRTNSLNSSHRLVDSQKERAAACGQLMKSVPTKPFQTGHQDARIGTVLDNPAVIVAECRRCVCRANYGHFYINNWGPAEPGFAI